MLFNSPQFLLVFLPVTFACYLLAGRFLGRQAAVGTLLFFSIVFYAQSSLFNLALFVGSILVNFTLMNVIARAGASRRTFLIFAIAANLALIGVFKYSGFFVTTVNDVFSTAFLVPHFLLPVGISFYTFQQIAALVDAYQTREAEGSLPRYALFVSAFPHLVAGPIVIPRELLPQLKSERIGRFNADDVAVGLTFLMFGLFKKVILADSLATYVSPVFSAVQAGQHPGFLVAWGGALSYSLQIYFDFSGYSDMAVGLGRLFGLRLPFNFDSPYRSCSIIEFWRRWHMTLSRFLRDYIYIPLGGNRSGPVRRQVNIVVTMLLGGLWHGANWTFVVWGGLHGVAIVVNHLWRQWRGGECETMLARWAGRLATFVFVVVVWVFFRAESMACALSMLKGMAGQYGMIGYVAVPPVPGWLQGVTDAFGLSAAPSNSGAAIQAAFCGLLLFGCWFLPNTQEFILQQGRPRRLAWAPSLRWAAALGVFFGIALTYQIVADNRVSEFIYFIF